MARKKARPQITAPQEKIRLHGLLARDLGIRIVSGQLKPGALLDNEIEASVRLKVSRTAYREAIRILGAKGLVHSRPKVGTRVALTETWNLLDPDVLSWIFEFEPPAKLINDIFELRKLVEPKAAALAATRRTESQLADMRRGIEGMRKHGLSTDLGRDADRLFHSALLRASDNAFFVPLTTSIAAAITWTTIYKQRAIPVTRDSMPDHQRVFNAIEAGDPDAAHAAMTVLIDLAFSDTLEARGIAESSKARKLVKRR